VPGAPRLSCHGGGGGDSESGRAKRSPRRRSSSAAFATVAAEALEEELAFKIGNADFDLAAWVRGFDFAGGHEGKKPGAASTGAAAAAAAAPGSVSVLAKWDTRRLAMPLVVWGSLSAEKKAR